MRYAGEGPEIMWDMLKKALRSCEICWRRPWDHVRYAEEGPEIMWDMLKKALRSCEICWRRPWDNVRYAEEGPEIMWDMLKKALRSCEICWRRPWDHVRYAEEGPEIMWDMLKKALRSCEICWRRLWDHVRYAEEGPEIMWDMLFKDFKLLRSFVQRKPWLTQKTNAPANPDSRIAAKDTFKLILLGIRAAANLFQPTRSRASQLVSWQTCLSNQLSYFTVHRCQRSANEKANGTHNL